MITKFDKTIALIGARGGSKRIPNKNLQEIGGFPLIAYSIMVGRASYFIDKTVVNTEDSEIARVAFEYEAEIPFMRDVKLASDTATDNDWVLDFLHKWGKKMGYYPKSIVFLRPTTPFRKATVINEAICTFEDDRSSLRSVEPLSENVEKTFKITPESKLVPSVPGVLLRETNLPNAHFDTSYSANGYVDILRTEEVLDNKDLYGSNIQGFVTPKTIEIDTLEDLEYARYVLDMQIGDENVN